eukprot:963922-Rhodomonas_salina.6
MPGTDRAYDALPESEKAERAHAQAGTSCAICLADAMRCPVLSSPTRAQAAKDRLIAKGLMHKEEKAQVSCH